MGEKKNDQSQSDAEQASEQTAANAEETTEAGQSSGVSRQVDGQESTSQNGDGVAYDNESSDQVAEATVEKSEVEILREELRNAQAKADEYLDQLQRTAAEFQNSRRRQEKQLADAIERANGSLVARLLPILDDFDLAFENATSSPESGADVPDSGDESSAASDQAWLDGFRQINKKLYDILRDQGLQPVDVNGEFDPVRHEAIASEPREDVESGHIIDVLRAGYEYKGRVLRPALVRVAS